MTSPSRRRPHSTACLSFVICCAVDSGPEAITVSSPIEPVTQKLSGQLAFAWALLLAFAGGILLNLMPCVLPVLSIKALRLVQHAQSAPREVRVRDSPMRPACWRASQRSPRADRDARCGGGDRLGLPAAVAVFRYH